MSGASTAQSVNNSLLTNGNNFGNRRKNGNVNTGKSEGKFKRRFNGAKKVIGRYSMPVAKGILGTGVGLTGAIIGFSTGVAQGDASKAFTRLATGATVGNYLVRNTADTVQKITKKDIEIAHNIADTYREDAYGEEYASNVKFDREFRKSEGYRKLKTNNPSSFSDEKVQQMLEAGITDPKKMDKILKKNAQHPRKYSIDKAIAYSDMAEKCPEKILYDDKQFIRFCQDKKIRITPEEIQKLRENIIDFK